MLRRSPDAMLALHGPESREAALSPVQIRTHARTHARIDATTHILPCPAFRAAEAEPLLRRSLDAMRALHGPESREAALSLYNLGSVLEGLEGRAAEAEAVYREGLAAAMR